MSHDFLATMLGTERSSVTEGVPLQKRKSFNTRVARFEY
jgi:hypothetical protein